jgi:hypothetical protein
MNSTQPSSTPRIHSAFGLEIRYERSFLVDMKTLEPAARQRIKQVVFEEFPAMGQLQDLPEFRQLNSSGIFYRFSCDRWFIGLEVTGHIVKFLRVLPQPEI